MFSYEPISPIVSGRKLNRDSAITYDELLALIDMLDESISSTKPFNYIFVRSYLSLRAGSYNLDKFVTVSNLLLGKLWKSRQDISKDIYGNKLNDILLTAAELRADKKNCIDTHAIHEYVMKFIPILNRGI